MRWVVVLSLCLVVACAAVPRGSAAPGSDPEATRGSAVAADAGVPPQWTRSEPPPSLPAMARVEPRAEEETLPNGLKVVVVPHHARPMVRVRLFLPDGAAADPAERSGATYFAMAALLGTHDRKRSTGDLIDPSEKSARRLILELGGAASFEVTGDRASVGIEGFSVDTEQYLRALAELVFQARHGEEAFAARIQAVADRLEELDVTDSAVFEAYLAALAFGEGHPYARPILGTAETIARLSLDEVVERQAALLVPNGSTLLVAGDVDPAAVRRTATRLFGTWRARGRGAPFAVRAPAVNPRRSVIFIPRSPAKTTVVCAGRPLTDVVSSRARLEVLARVLSQRLGEALRERRGLTYDARASLLELKRGRALVACSRLDGGETPDAVRLFLDTLGQLGTPPISEAEVAAARATLVAEVEASADELGGIERVWGAAIALGVPVSISGRAGELSAVTAGQLEALAPKVMRLPVFQVVVSGERGRIEPVVQSLKLGPLRTPRLSRAPVE